MKVWRATTRIKDILKSNEGASLVLVSVLAIVVLTAVIMLRVTSGTFMASASKQLNQDQAYELAASMGESIDNLIADGKLDINAVPLTANAEGIEESVIVPRQDGFDGLPDSNVVAKVVRNSSNGNRMLVVESHVGQASYVYTKEYR